MCTPHVHARVHVQNEHASNTEEGKSTIFTSMVYEANRASENPRDDSAEKKKSGEKGQ
jgi:hypothetical protein